MTILRKVGRIRGIEPNTLQPGRGLVEVGFKSLDLAQIVALLEQRLGVDPFEHVPITDVRTIADLCAAYERATAGSIPAPAPEARARPTTDSQSTLAQRRRAAREDLEGA